MTHILSQFGIVISFRSPKFQSNSAKNQTSLQITNEVFVDAKKFQFCYNVCSRNLSKKFDLSENESMKLLCCFRLSKEKNQEKLKQLRNKIC
jgi:hypothetical protein